MFEFGPPPKVLGAASNIFVAVPSSTWTSMPMTGSYFLIASSYFTWSVLPRGCRAREVRRPRGRPPTGRPRVHHGVLTGRSEDLEAHGQAVGEAGGQESPGMPARFAGRVATSPR